MTEEILVAKSRGGSKVWAAPGSGIYQGVLVDLLVKRDVERVYEGEKKVKDEIQLVFQLTELITEADVLAAANGTPLTDKDREQIGSRFLVRTKPYTFELSVSYAKKQTHLTGFMEAWRGKRVPDEEVDTFNFVPLIGKNATLVINRVQDTKDPKKFHSNITGITAWNGTPTEVVDYIRVKDRKTDEQAASAQSTHGTQATQSTQDTQSPPPTLSTKYIN